MSQTVLEVCIALITGTSAAVFGLVLRVHARFILTEHNVSELNRKVRRMEKKINYMLPGGYWSSVQKAGDETQEIRQW